jgi:PAT family beta-lactamase induction signal transducer AmpG
MLLDDELGTGNSIFINAYRVSSLIPGSLAFVLADLLPWSMVFWVVALFMSVGIVTTLLVPETSNDQIAPRSVREAVIEPFAEFFNRDGVKPALLVLSFMLFYKLGDNMAVALQTPFFIDIGFTLTEIGVIAKFVILGSTTAGALLGGLLMLRLSINRALWIFGFVQIISIFGYAALAKIGGNIYALVVATSLEYLGVGLGTVALTAFMAKQTSRRFTATQFALLTSLTAVPRTLANAATGFIVEAVGYFSFFLLCVVVAIPGMLLLLVVAPWSESEKSGEH